MPFPIMVRRDLSISQLRRIHDEGGSVVKTPHVGNVYPNNLGVAAAGLRMLFYDRTIGKRDRNFHPHGVIRSSRFESLADLECMSSHVRARKTSTLAPDWFPCGASMRDGHMASLHKAIPELQAEVYTDYLLAHAEEVVEILRSVVDIHATLWERSVSENGEIHSFACQNWNQLKQVGIFGVTSSTHGAIIPNILNILLISILEVRDRNVLEVYHLSGPDMVVYIGKLQSLLDEMYDTVRARLSDWHLPQTLPFHLIPVADVRFVVLPARQAALDELIDAYLAGQQNSAKCAERIKMANGDRYQVVSEVEKLRSVDRARLREAVQSCPDVFYRIQDANSVSQYDVLDAGGIYVHPWAIQTPMSEISTALQFMNRYTNKS